MTNESLDQEVVAINSPFPLLDLPDKLLAHIFSYLLMPRPNAQQVKDVVDLQIVCKRFRDIVDAALLIVYGDFFYANHTNTSFDLMRALNILPFAYKYKDKYPITLDRILEIIFISEEFKGRDTARYLTLRLKSNKLKNKFTHHDLMTRYMIYKNKKQQIENTSEEAVVRKELVDQYLIMQNMIQMFFLGKLIIATLDQKKVSIEQCNKNDHPRDYEDSICLRLLIFGIPSLQEICGRLKIHDFGNFPPQDADISTLENIFLKSLELECAPNGCVEHCIEILDYSAYYFSSKMSDIKDDQFATRCMNAFLKKRDSRDSIKNGTAEQIGRQHVAKYFLDNRKKNDAQGSYLFKFVFDGEKPCYEWHFSKCNEISFSEAVERKDELKELYNELIKIPSMRKLTLPETSFIGSLYRKYCDRLGRHYLVHHFSPVILGYLFLDFLIIFLGPIFFLIFITMCVFFQASMWLNFNTYLAPLLFLAAGNELDNRDWNKIMNPFASWEANEEKKCFGTCIEFLHAELPEKVFSKIMLWICNGLLGDRRGKPFSLGLLDILIFPLLYKGSRAIASMENVPAVIRGLSKLLQIILFVPYYVFVSIVLTCAQWIAMIATPFAALALLGKTIYDEVRTSNCCASFFSTPPAKAETPVLSAVNHQH